MKIVACIKHSLDVSEIKVEKNTREIDLDGVPRVVGNIDQNVLEAAVALKEAYGGSVHGLTYASLEAKQAYWEAMAMGLDDITMVVASETDTYNPSVTAFVLAEAIKKIGDVDVVICGEVSDDGFTYQVPSRLAERLNFPQISFARSIRLEEDALLVDRELEDGAQFVSVKPPALISITEETNTPRRPTLMEAMQAKKRPINIWNPESELGLSPEALEEKKYLKRVKTEGIVVARKRQMLKGTDQLDLANQLVDKLIEEEIFKGGTV